MDQNLTEKNFAPESAPEGELKRPETPVSPELELPKETTESTIEYKAGDEIQEQAVPTLPPTRKKTALPQPARDQLTIKVEKILASGLEDTFRALPPLTQQEFKLKGEQTSSKIRELLRATKIKVKKIFHLILEWLSILPGINRFFLEQEAKIKTDQIIELKKRDDEKIHI